MREKQKLNHSDNDGHAEREDSHLSGLSSCPVWLYCFSLCLCVSSRRRVVIFFSLPFCALIVGCGRPPSPTSLPDADGGLQAKEAPMLARLVREGKLPPLP